MKEVAYFNANSKKKIKRKHEEYIFKIKHTELVIEKLAKEN